MSQNYRSVFALYLSGLVATKQATGYKYETAEYYLHHFDRYCLTHAQGASLTRELVLDWAKAKDRENPGTHRTRISPVRELGRYMQSLGVSEAFVLPTALHCKIGRHRLCVSIRRSQRGLGCLTEHDLEVFP